MTSLPPLRVIPYTAVHQHSILTLFTSGMRDNLASYPDETTRQAIHELVSKALAGLQPPPETLSLYLVITPDNTPIAMGGLQRSRLDAENEAAELTRISVAREWRGRGVCSIIVAKLVRVAVNQFKVRTVYLYTMNSVVSAVRAYAKLGFRMEGQGGEKPALVCLSLQVANCEWWKEEV